MAGNYSGVAGKRWMGLVARVGCVLCSRHMGINDTPAQVHHMKLGTGASDRASDFLTIALCPEHHVGALGVHKLKEHGIYLRYKCSEIDLLADTVSGVNDLLYNTGARASTSTEGVS
jgi:hypothetical protein